MNQQSNSKKWAIAVILLFSMQLAYAALSFTGIIDEKTKNSKYSLRSLHQYSKKGLSLSAIKSTLQYRGMFFPLNSSSSFTKTEITSMIQYDNGHTSYVYPYKIKVKVPKFKTPQPSH